MGLTPTLPTESQSSDDLKKASQLAKKATASLGKFQENLPKKLEKQVKAPNAKKRKFDPLVSSDEKAKNLRVLNELTSKKAKMDVTKAVGQQINADERAQSAEKRNKNNKKGLKKGQRPQKGRNRGNFGKKKGGQGAPGGGKKGGEGRK